MSPLIENPNPYTRTRRDRIFVPVINGLCHILLSKAYRNALGRYINQGIVAEFYRGGREYPAP
jgi:hypothetical protein